MAGSGCPPSGASAGPAPWAPAVAAHGLHDVLHNHAALDEDQRVAAEEHRVHCDGGGGAGRGDAANTSTRSEFF